MVNTKCKNCTKFLTNDCQGLADFNPDACANMLKQKNKEIDVTGCC